jgi:hypothetical protein
VNFILVTERKIGVAICDSYFQTENHSP